MYDSEEYIVENIKTIQSGPEPPYPFISVVDKEQIFPQIFYESSMNEIFCFWI